MIIAITGTPGCGKTAVARLLRKKCCKVIDLKRFAISNGCVAGIDRRRSTKEIDVPMLNRKLKQHIGTRIENREPRIVVSNRDSRSHESRIPQSAIFIEGHLSHLLDFADIVVVLRCAPSVLAGRLRRKGWRRAKVTENVQAEALGIITFEAIELRKGGSKRMKSGRGRGLNTRSVFELDSTNAAAEALAENVLEIASGKNSGSRWRVGRISWLKDVTEHREILDLLME